MRKRVLWMFLCAVIACSATAQTLLVKSFGCVQNDEDANLSAVSDNLGRKCALIKVSTLGCDCKLSFGMEGVMKVQPRSSEIWVYVPAGTKKILFSLSQSWLKREYWFPEPVQGGTTYRLELYTCLSHHACPHESLPIATQFQSEPEEGISTKYSTFCLEKVLFNMVLVEGGTFWMGATKEQVNEAEADELPEHPVTLSDYFIGQTEVTQALWKAVMGNNPSSFVGESLPVDKVSWNEIQLFLQKLSAAVGREFRLPTEAEWEYAARGGKKSKGYKYSGSNEVAEVAWYWANSNNKTHPVAQHTANELELYDMSGNVNEWCADWKDNYSKEEQNNPLGPDTGSHRVLRGGCWNDFAIYCRISDRYGYSPDTRKSYNGFRLAMSVQ